VGVRNTSPLGEISLEGVRGGEEGSGWKCQVGTGKRREREAILRCCEYEPEKKEEALVS